MLGWDILTQFTPVLHLSKDVLTHLFGLNVEMNVWRYAFVLYPICNCFLKQYDSDSTV